MVGSALGGAMSGLLGSLVGMLASIPLVAVAKSVFVYYWTDDGDDVHDAGDEAEHGGVGHADEAEQHAAAHAGSA